MIVLIRALWEYYVSGFFIRKAKQRSWFRRLAKEQIDVILGRWPRADLRTDPTSLLKFFRRIAPIETEHPLIRIGSPSDGGYLVPADLEGIEHCFSPGVGTRSDFELELAEREIRCFLADYSVEGPPKSSTYFTFDKKFLGVSNSETHMTLQSWVEKHLPSTNRDAILQMDIEGDEYAVLESVTPALLDCFRILVIEFHRWQKMIDRNFFNRCSTIFEHLQEKFEVVHIHPNNGNKVIYYRGIPIPRTLEFTFLRKDRISKRLPAAHFPHPLDAANVPSRPPIHLPRCWYKPVLSDRPVGRLDF